jgi:hypothetical protein
VEFLVILFFFGLSAGVVGRYKGSSFFLWFLIGFCLPFLGTLAALLFRSERNEPRRRCDRCGTEVRLHDQVCMRCGEDLVFPDEAPEGAAAGAPEAR